MALMLAGITNFSGALKHLCIRSTNQVVWES
jgi:hypothetical protein